MPNIKEHSAVVKSSTLFIKDSIRSKDIARGVRILIGKLKKGNGSMVTKSYRFDKSLFTAEQARTWLKSRNIRYIDFEPAGRD